MLTGTHFNYYQVCKRKLWLFANGINMEHTSDLVLEGRLIHEDSYPQRSGKYEEIELDGIKVDFYDPKQKVIHEIKKSNKVDVDRERIQEMEVDIQRIISEDACPPSQKRGICRNCSYFDFCYSGEEDE